MWILIVPSWYLTEDKPMVGIFFKEQAQALIGAGHDCCVVYPDLRFQTGTLKMGLFKADDAPPTYLYRRRTVTPFLERGRWPQRALMLERLYQRALREWGKPDIVHLHSCRMGVETLRLCQKHGLPLVYTEHYSGIMQKRDSALDYAFQRTLAGCDRAIAVSDRMRSVMRVYRGDAVTVPNLVDTGAFHIMGQPEQENGFVFAAMGGLTPVKGYDMLIRAFSAAADRMLGAKLVIAGDGPQRESLEKLVSDLSMADRIRFCGAVARADAPAFYQSVHCLVCSSICETFGMTLIEALACGKPVIATACGGPQDIVTPQNGMLVGIGDTEAMAAAMRSVYQDYGRFDSRLIREDCERRFGAKAVTDKITKIYEEVLQSRNGARND